MCVVSMVTDHYRDKWYPYTQPPYTSPSYPYTPQTLPATDLGQFLAQQQAPKITDAEIAEFRALLTRAREYDRRNNEPECELSEKRDALLAIAKQLGVEINFL